MKTHFDRRVLARNYLEQIHLILAKHSAAYAKKAVAHAREIIRDKQQHQIRHSAAHTEQPIAPAKEDVRKRPRPQTDPKREQDKLYTNVSGHAV